MARANSHLKISYSASFVASTSLRNRLNNLKQLLPASAVLPVSIRWVDLPKVGRLNHHNLNNSNLASPHPLQVCKGHHVTCRRIMVEWVWACPSSNDHSLLSANTLASFLPEWRLLRALWALHLGSKVTVARRVCQDLNSWICMVMVVDVQPATDSQPQALSRVGQPP